MDELQQEYLKSQNFKPYIKSIVFPKYKNIFPSSEINFNYPLTLLIGKNGTNKSSILHALYGCPAGKSTAEYWFSTHVDPIDDPPSYFYRYDIPETGDIAEVLMTQIKKESLKKGGVKKKYDPDYWEPSRPILEYGMNPMPKLEKTQPIPAGRSKTRWNAIKKPIVYLDFRSEISAFDKAFYRDERHMSRPAHRALLRKRSKSLKLAIVKALTNCSYHGKQRIVTNYKFTCKEKAYVNSILNSSYEEITYIEHDFYLSGSFSVYLKKGATQNYSEAFAGSGETSVVRLVYALERALQNALVLLDEPETSLHIDAQYNLQKYIIEKIKQKKLQVVISTHSPYFAKGLPESAIKILSIDPSDGGKVKIINSAPAHESSFHLGYKNQESDKVNIFVEDELARSLVSHVCDTKLTSSQKDLVSIQLLGGGATQMVRMAGTESVRPNSSIAYLFDGDKKPTSGIPDQSNIPPSENSNLENIIKDAYEQCPTIPRNPTDDKSTSLRNFLDFAKDRFRYLPFKNPDIFIVENHEDFKNKSGDAKDILKTYYHEKLGTTGEIDAKNCLTIQRILINEISPSNPKFEEIADIIRDLIQIAPAAQAN